MAQAWATTVSAFPLGCQSQAAPAPQTKVANTPATVPSATLTAKREQLRNFVEVECGASFEEFQAMMVATGWFEAADAWEKYESINDIDLSRILNVKHGIKNHIIKLHEAQLAEAEMK
jgi:hypothetical protein